MNDKKETRKGNTPIKVWVTPSEKAAIEANAKTHALSTSAFLRNVGLGIEVKGVLDQKAIIELVKINADQGRLGGLLKLWLTNDEKLSVKNHVQLTNSIETLLEKIYEIQDLLFERVSKF